MSTGCRMDDSAHAVEHEDGRGFAQGRGGSMTAPHPKENEAPFCQEAGADTLNGAADCVSKSGKSRS
jgi:hypothetical protein